MIQASVYMYDSIGDCDDTCIVFLLFKAYNCHPHVALYTANPRYIYDTLLVMLADANLRKDMLVCVKCGHCFCTYLKG